LIPPLYAVLDADSAERAGWTLIDLAAACVAGGARFLQLRAKHAAGGVLLDAATRLAGLAHAAGAILIVNDRAEIARLSGADGVHVGQDDLPPAAVRRIVGPDALVGFSTHTPAQLAAAVQEPVNYVAVGPVFETSTKATGYDAIGLDAVHAASRVAHERRLPLVAIGGITLDTAPSVIGAGATSVAVIGDLLAGGDPAARVRDYLERLKTHARTV
jgi:thiamine-phosphate pyrophosphorylase